MNLALPSRYVDLANILIIIVTCLVAHLYPYQLLLISYAILGPLHYFTQISWLHDRKYFTSLRIAPYGLILLSLVLFLFNIFPIDHSPTSFALILYAALGLATMAVIPQQSMLFLSLVLVLLLGLGFGAYQSRDTLIAIAFLLPTVIHVFVFTAAFMLLGARKTNSPMAYLSFVTLLLGALSFFVLPLSPQGEPHLTGLLYFRGVAIFLGKIFHKGRDAEAAIFGFLSFVYTYHYLNWFSKAEVIRWHTIPKNRMAVIGLLYGVTLLCYGINYNLGFMVVLLFSLMHVILEFPLNVRTFAALMRGRQLSSTAAN